MTSPTPAAPAQLLAEAGEVDVLVANAGLPGSGRLNSFSVEEIDRALMVNLRAPMMLARALSEQMVARGRGHIVFMSSRQRPRGDAGQLGLHRDEVRPARLRARAARGPGRQARRRERDPAGLHPRRGHVRRLGRQAAAYVGTKRPEDVARAVVKAIEHNRAEIDVAPLPLRAGTILASLAPGPVGSIQRQLGAAATAEQFERGQADKR